MYIMSTTTKNGYDWIARNDGNLYVYSGRYNPVKRVDNHTHFYLLNFPSSGKGVWWSKSWKDTDRAERIFNIHNGGSNEPFGVTLSGMTNREYYNLLAEFYSQYMEYPPVGDWLRNHTSNSGKIVWYGIPNTGNDNDRIIRGYGWTYYLACRISLKLPYVSGVLVKSDNTPENGNSFTGIGNEFYHFNIPKNDPAQTQPTSSTLQYQITNPDQIIDRVRPKDNTDDPYMSILRYTFSDTIKHLVIEPYGSNTHKFRQPDRREDILPILTVTGNNNKLYIKLGASYTIENHTSGFDKNNTFVYVSGTNNQIIVDIANPLHFENKPSSKNISWCVLTDSKTNKIAVVNKHNLTTNDEKLVVGFTGEKREYPTKHGPVKTFNSYVTN